MRGLARMLREGGEACGAGFLISPRHLCTCAHVVNLALGLEARAQACPEPGRTLGLDFPHLDATGSGPPDPPRTATVVRWHPPPTGPQPGPHDDIAVLLLDRPHAAAAVPRLAAPADPPPVGTPGAGWGTPHGTKEGLWAPATLSGPSGALRQLDLGLGPEVQPGFSGGPFTDADHTLIHGMVVQSDQGARAAWMLPLAALRPVWESLRTIELALRLTAGRLYAEPGGPAAGTRFADLQAAVADGDPAALHRALFAAAAGSGPPGADLAAAASLDALGLGPKRLRLRCRQAAAAALPWHCLTTPAGARLGADDWVIEVVGPTARQAAVRTILQALILAPADSQLAPGVHLHVDQVSAALAPLLPHPRLRQVPWALNAHDLARLLKAEPDLVYCYAWLRPEGLLLGRDAPSREGLPLADLIRYLNGLPVRPLLWLHCLECAEAPLDLDRLLADTADYPLLLVQRTAPGEGVKGLKRRTLAWLAELAAAPVLEPAAILSRLGDPGTCARLGQDGLVLARPADPAAALYAYIHAALLQLLLGRTAEKDLLRARVTAAGSALVLYFVCGNAQARVHDFADQCHWHLEEQENPPRVRPTPIPAAWRPDQDTATLRHQLCEALQIDPNLALAADGLTGLARSRLLPAPLPALLPAEVLLVSLPWLLEPAPGVSPAGLGAWLGRWKAAVLQTFEAADIPDGFRVLTGCCLQWEGDWPQAHGTTALALQRAAVAVLQSGNPAHCNWVRFTTPLDRLEQSDLEDFFSNEQRRLRDYTGGWPRGALVDWVWEQGHEGLFDDTVRAIYRGCQTHFSDVRPGGPA